MYVFTHLNININSLYNPNFLLPCNLINHMCQKLGQGPLSGMGESLVLFTTHGKSKQSLKISA